MPKSASIEVIAARILEIRGRKVMLDRDLAELYDVSAKVLNQAVKRNIKRFPEDFMFRLSWEEMEFSRSQFVTLNKVKLKTSGRGGNIKYLPYAFTEQGVAMLSSILNSERAIQVNILIMRAFVKLKEMLLTHKDLTRKIEILESQYTDHDYKIKIIFETIKKLLEPSSMPEKPKIGFHPNR